MIKQDSQTTKELEQDTPSISTKNRFEMLRNESLSAVEDMEMDKRAEEENSFVKILRDKNNKKANKHSSQLLNNIQAVTQNSNTSTTSQMPTRHNISNNNKARGTTGTSLSSSQEKWKRLPPLNIFNQDPKDTWKLTKEITVKIMVNTTFHIKRVNDNKHILQMDNVENFKKVKQALLEANTNFFSFTSKEDKNTTFLLKDLNQTFDTQEILEELKQQKLENITFNKVSRFITRRFRRTGFYLSTWCSSPQTATQRSYGK